MKYIKIVVERSDKMKINFKENCKSLFKSAIHTNDLIERRNKSWFAPIIILILSTLLMLLPNYISSTNIKKDALMGNFPGIDKAYDAIINSSLDCKVVDGSLSCSGEQTTFIDEAGEDIIYTVAIKPGTQLGDTSVNFNNDKLTDNLVVLYDNYIKIRYIQRDYVKEKIQNYEIIGNYSKLEGFNLKEIANRIKENPDSLKNETADFVSSAYKSTLNVGLYASFIAYVIPFFLFVLITSFMLISPTLLKRKKGLKFGECMKISITSSLPAIFISAFAYLLLGMNIPMVLGVVYLVRISYIYIKYFMSNKNNIYKTLYSTTGEERFNF